MFLFRQPIILIGFYCINFHQKRSYSGNRRQFSPAESGISCLVGRQVGGRFDFFILPTWKIGVWRTFCFVCRRLALLQKLVHPEGCVLLQMCQTRVGQKI
jgi:hypothetical protein